MSESDPEVERYARRLLEMADANGVFPTPVDDIVAQAGLLEANESLLSPGLLARAPARIRRAMRDIIGKIRGILDRKERVIHLDPEVRTESRRRFIKLHEVFHHVLPWHKPMVRVDTDETLSDFARAEFEAEASVGAAHVLFQVNGYSKQIADFPIGIGAVTSVAPTFGASLRSGLRRYVERNPVPMIGFVLDVSPEPDLPLRYRRREIIPSNSFTERFGQLWWGKAIRADKHSFLVEAAASAAARGTAVCGTWQRADITGEIVNLQTEFYCTGFDILGLIWLPPSVTRRRALKRSA